jgi:hypothetical protein
MSRRPLFTALGALVAVLVAACATGGDRRADTWDESIDAGAAPSSPGDFSDAGADRLPVFGECEEETKQIFVLSTDKALHRFEPETLQFVRVGTIGCPSAAGTFSMAVDRRGTAWVELTDGRLYAVDTRDGSCKPTAFQPGQTGFTTFGMGYAKDGDDTNAETLYVAGAGLAALDTTTFALDYRGSLSFGRTELTGMGSALFGYGVSSGVIAGLNKATGATEVVHRTSAVEHHAAFAFAHWGGDFYVFTGQTTSKVTRYSPETDISTVVVDNTGMLIVGAGSSTCAPTSPR